MTHDPLCYLYREGGDFDLMADICVNCRLIAKVRADERMKAASRVMSLRHGASLSVAAAAAAGDVDAGGGLVTHDSACSCQESLCGDCSLYGGDDQCFCVCEPALRGEA